MKKSMFLVIIATSITSLHIASYKNTHANNNQNVTSLLSKSFFKDYDHEGITKQHASLKEMRLLNTAETIRNVIAQLRSKTTTNTTNVNQNNQG